jgi:hypothetical protein
VLKNGRTRLVAGRILTKKRNVRFEVLTAVVMKSIIFSDITSCSPLKVNQRFGGIYRLHPQGRRISRVRNQDESKWQAERGFLLGSFFDPEDGGDMFL